MDGRIDLERARREAKALLSAARAGEPAALERLRADRTPRLADAQRAVARTLGARSWPALVREVERGDELIRAAAEGRSEDVYALLEAGAPANPRDPRRGGTALHVAAAAGRVDVVDVLVGWRPVDLHARDADGRTALAACLEGDGADAQRRVIAEILVSVGRHLQGGIAAFAEAALAADVALLAYLAGAAGAETRRVGDGFAVVTGTADNARNGVVASRATEKDIVETLDWLAARGVPGQWHVGAETEPPDLGALLEHAGCQAESTAVSMAMALAGAVLDAPSPVAIGRTDLDGQLPLRHYGAWSDGRRIGLVSALPTPAGTLSVLDLHVVAGERRRGVGRALLQHALRAGRDAGLTLAVLAPTPATVPYYEKLGFALGRLPAGRRFYTPVP